jgi:hypothetical protein
MLNSTLKMVRGKIVEFYSHAHRLSDTPEGLLDPTRHNRADRGPPE